MKQLIITLEKEPFGGEEAERLEDAIATVCKFYLCEGYVDSDLTGNTTIVKKIPEIANEILKIGYWMNK